MSAFDLVPQLWGYLADQCVDGAFPLLMAWMSDETLHLSFPQFQRPLQNPWRQPSTFGLDLKLEALIACAAVGPPHHCRRKGETSSRPRALRLSFF